MQLAILFSEALDHIHVEKRDSEPTEARVPDCTHLEIIVSIVRL